MGIERFASLLNVPRALFKLFCLHSMTGFGGLGPRILFSGGFDMCYSFLIV